MPENFEADANARFSPTFLLLNYYLEFYIRLQRESSNKGD